RAQVVRVNHVDMVAVDGSDQLDQSLDRKAATLLESLDRNLRGRELLEERPVLRTCISVMAEDTNAEFRVGGHGRREGQHHALEAADLKMLREEEHVSPAPLRTGT